MQIQGQIPVQFNTLSADNRIVALINSVISLNLKKGIANALDAKLSNSLKALEDTNVNNNVAAVNMLYAFIANVEAQRGAHIDNIEADALVIEAQSIIDLLNTLWVTIF